MFSVSIIFSGMSLVLFHLPVLEISQRTQLVRRATLRQMQLVPHNFNLPCTIHLKNSPKCRYLKNVFVCLRLHLPVINFSALLGRLPLPGFNQYQATGMKSQVSALLKDTTPCSRTQHCAQVRIEPATL